MDFGQAIKMLRTEHNMTQTQLAEACGTSDSAVSSWETGKAYPPKGTIERVCQALGVSTLYLVLNSIEDLDIPAKNRVAVLALLKPLRNLLIDQEP